MTIGTLDPTKPLLNEPATPGHQELQDIKAAVQATFVGMQATPGTTDVQQSTGPAVDSAVALAGTALQPGAAVSLLVNDAGYQTAGDVDADIAAHEAASDPHAAADYQNSVEVTALSQAVVDVHNNSSGAHAGQDWQSGTEVTVAIGNAFGIHNTDPNAHASEDWQSGAEVDATVSAHNTSPSAHTAEFAKYQLVSEKGNPNGYAELDGTGKVPAAQLPPASSAGVFSGLVADPGASLPAGWSSSYDAVNDWWEVTTNLGTLTATNTRIIATGYASEASEGEVCIADVQALPNNNTFRVKMVEPSAPTVGVSAPFMFLLDKV